MTAQRDLCDLLARERAVAALAGEPLGREALLDVARQSPAWARLCTRGSALRLALRLLPRWYTGLLDPTQVDGRVLVKGDGRFGIELQIPGGGPSYTIDHWTLLDALERGEVLEGA